MNFNVICSFDRKRGKDNLWRCTYVLPDGVTHTKGFVKDPDAARRYLALDGDAAPPPQKLEMEVDDVEEPTDRKKADLTKNVGIFISLEV